MKKTFPVMPHENGIAACVRATMIEYFKDLGDEKPHEIYPLVMACVEKPLIETVLQYAGNNQTKAAEALGINRNTLRKKMQQYGIK